jgi:aminoglycoside phosphotransferase (APT) family kinase protein
VILVPASLRERIEAVTGVAPRSLDTVGPGRSNLVGGMTVGDRRLVVKAAQRREKRADVQREDAVLALLADVPAVPKRVGSLIDDEWSVLVMEHIGGEAGLDCLPAGPPAAKRRAADQLVVLLAASIRAVHALAPGPVSTVDMQRLGLEMDRRMNATADALRADSHGLLEHDREIVVEALADRVHNRGVAFLHGDPGLHNMLIRTADSPTSPALGAATLVDWEMAGFGNPLHDVAWATWTLRHRGVGPIALASFHDTYGSTVLKAMGWTDSVGHRIVSAQMGALLIRTRQDSVERTVWQERITAHIAAGPAE